jgi:flagellar protein FliO/FliZ
VAYQMDGLPSLSLGLGVIIVLLAAAAWALRRTRPNGFVPRNDDCRIIRGLSLGPRERLYVIAVGAKQLVIGVSAGAISLLCELPTPLPPAAPASAAFADVVRKAREKWRGE